MGYLQAKVLRKVKSWVEACVRGDRMKKVCRSAATQTRLSVLKCIIVVESHELISDLNLI